MSITPWMKEEVQIYIDAVDYRLYLAYWLPVFQIIFEIKVTLVIGPYVARRWSRQVKPPLLNTRCDNRAVLRRRQDPFTKRVVTE